MILLMVLYVYFIPCLDTISSSMSSVGLTGIIGLYAGVIYTIGRLVRNTFIPKPETLMYGVYSIVIQ